MPSMALGGDPVSIVSYRLEIANQTLNFWCASECPKAQCSEKAAAGKETAGGGELLAGVVSASDTFN